MKMDGLGSITQVKSLIEEWNLRKRNKRNENLTKKNIFDATDDSVSATATKHSNNSENKNIIQDLI